MFITKMGTYDGAQFLTQKVKTSWTPGKKKKVKT